MTQSLRVAGVSESQRRGLLSENRAAGVVVEKGGFRPPGDEHDVLVGQHHPTAERIDCGQPSGGPAGDVDHSCARIIAPISPPPARDALLWPATGMHLRLA